MTLDIIDTRQLDPTTRVRIQHYDGSYGSSYVVTSEQYFPSALDAGPDGWRDTFATFPRTLEDAEKAFQDRIDDLVRYYPDRFASDDRGSAVTDATRPV